MLNRHTSFLLIIAAAIALPVSVYFALGARADHRGLQTSLLRLQQQQNRLAAFDAQVKNFQNYQATLSGFNKSASEYGITAENWDTHRVDVKDMFLGFDQVENFVADMSPGDNAFFIPEKAKIVARPTVTRAELAGTNKSEPEPGGITLSLSGTFIVER